LGLATAAAGAVALIWSNSRGATLSALLALALVFLPHYRRWLVPGVLAVIVALGVFVAFEGGDPARLSRSGEVEELTTFTGRTDVWRLAVDRVAEEPVTGWGVGASYDVFGEQLRQGAIWWPPHDAHNVYLTVLLETGLVGGLFFGAGLGAVLLRLVPQVRRNPWPLALLAVTMWNGLTDSVILWPGLGIVALSVAVTAASGIVLDAPAPEQGYPGSGVTTYPVPRWRSAKRRVAADATPWRERT
jgi:O-antigen ligase